MKKRMMRLLSLLMSGMLTFSQIGTLTVFAGSENDDDNFHDEWENEEDDDSDFGDIFEIKFEEELENDEIEDDYDEEEIEVEDSELLGDPVISSDGEVSRMDWWLMLIDVFDYTVEANNYPDNYFSDINSSDPHYRDIMVATEFGLVDVEAGGALNADADATREFAAHSLNLCLGFLLDQDAEYTFSEAEEVTYPNDIQVALNKGWFEMESGDFLPEKSVTASEMDNIREYATQVLERWNTKYEGDNSWTFASGVVDITMLTDAEMTDEDEFTFSNCNTVIESGTIYGFLVDDMPVVRKIVSVNSNGDDYVAKVESVSTEEAYEELRFSDEGMLDLKGALADEDNTTIQYVVGGTMEANYEDGDVFCSEEEVRDKEVSAIIVTQEYDIPEGIRDDFARGYDNPEDIQDDFAREFGIPSTEKAIIRCIIGDPFVSKDVDCVKIMTHNQSAYVQVSIPVTVTCNISADVLKAVGIPNSVNLVKLPLLGGIGYVKVSMDMNISGSVNLTYKEFVSVGVRYNNSDGFSLYSDHVKEDFTINAKANIGIGVKVAAGFDIGVLKGEAYGKVGAEAEVKATYHDDGKSPETCLDVFAWLYLKYGYKASFNFWIYKDSWGDEENILTRNNSPVKVSLHYEDGKAVSRCTRDGAEAGTVNGNTTVDSNGRYRYYTPANSRYGYNGTAKGIDSEGNEYTVYEYSLDENNNATITKYNGNVSGLVIPETLDGYTVVGIGSSVFKGHNELISVYMPDTVTKIGYSAFHECKNLNNVEFSSNLTSIGNYAFDRCGKLSGVELPKSLINLGAGAFYDCDSIESIEIPKGLESASASFDGCDGLKKVTFEEGTTQVVAELFKNCPGIEEITIPDTVTKIGYSTFRGCKNLSNVKFSSNLTSIGNGAFSGCSSLDNVIIPDEVTSIGNYVFEDCIALKKITIPEERETITAGMFLNCSGLEEIKLPDNTKKIEADAFKGCTSLKMITIPENVTVIGNEAFRGCVSLEGIQIKSSDTLKIGDNAFQDCEKLAVIEMPDTVKSIGAYCFDNCMALKDVSLSTAITVVPKNAFSNCGSLESIDLPYYVTTIGEYAFLNDTKLARISIPRATTTISNNAFSYPDILVIYGVSGTTAETFATENGFKFVEASVPATAVSFLRETYTIHTNETLTLSYEISPENATDERIWTVSKNSDRISITDGVVKGLKATDADDPAVVKLAVGDQIASCKIIVLQSVTSIGLNKTSVTMDAGSSFQLIATVNPSTASDKDVEWSASDETSATVDDNGLVTAVGKGSCTITVTAKDGGTVSRSCTITVPNTATYVESAEDFQSAHPYEKNSSNIWVYEKENADSISVTFSEETELEADSDGDYILIKDENGKEIGKYYGAELAGKTVTVEGSKVWLQLVSDAIDSKDYGYSVTKIETDVPATIAVTGVSLNKTVLELTEGDVTTLTVTVQPTEATNQKVSWSSDKEEVATVDGDGKVTAVAAGTATITVTTEDGGKTASCKVTVTEKEAESVPVESVSLNMATLELTEGETAELEVSIVPDEATNKTVIWSSDNEEVATVDENGKVTAVAAGTAMITVVTEDGEKMAGCEVTVTAAKEESVSVNSVNLNNAELELKEGESETLTATVAPEEAANKAVSWSSSDEKVAKVDENGKVTAVTAGTATITVMTEDGGLTASCTVTVTKKQEQKDYGKTPTLVTDENGETHVYVNNKPNDSYKGLALNDGKFVYVSGCKVDESKNGYVEYDGGKFFVVKGNLDTKANGLVQDIDHTEDWYYCSNGQVQSQYTGLALYDGAWFYINKGKLDTTLAAYVEYDGGLFYVAAGRILKEVSGLAKDPNGTAWYYLAEGQAQTQYTGLAFYDGEWFYVIAGKLAEDYTGPVDYDGETFNVVSGMVK